MESIIYLGVTIDQRVTCTEHIDRIVLEANRVRGYVYRDFRKCSVDVKAKVYKTLIQPIMELCGCHAMPRILLKLNQYKGVWFTLCLMIIDHNVVLQAY